MLRLHSPAPLHWSVLVLLLALLPALALAQTEAGWDLHVYTGGGIGCASIERALALPDEQWLRPDVAPGVRHGIRGGSLWLRLSPQAPQAESKLVLRWEHNATLSDWRDPEHRTIRHEPGHAPGFTVVDLPDSSNRPLLFCLVAPAPRVESFSIMTPLQLQGAERVAVLWMSLLAGVILATSTMGLAFFLRIREPAFASFAVFSVSMLGFLLGTIGALPALLPKPLQAMSYPLTAALASFAGFAGMHFGLHFARLDRDWPRSALWLRRLGVLVLLAVIPILLSLAPFRAGSGLMIAGVLVQNFSIVTIIAMLMLLAAISAWQGQREPRIYLLSWLPLLALVLLAALAILGLLPASLRLSPLWIMSATSLASLVLGWGLVDNARRDRIERDQAIARASRDPLTGASSRAALRPLLEAASEHAMLLYLDLDHFKQINDSHGHGVGDRCLQRFAQRCQAQLRGRDVLARHGGEEFLALLPETGLEEGLRVAERVRLAVAAPADGEPTYTVSVGVAQRRAEESVHEWIARADAALYAAKESGRNRVCKAP